MPPGVSVGLVPFVKNHYREMLREHARLKQQLLVQFQQNKKKKGSSSSSKTKRRSAKPSPPQSIVRANTRRTTAKANDATMKTFRRLLFLFVPAGLATILRGRRLATILLSLTTFPLLRRVRLSLLLLLSVRRSPLLDSGAALPCPTISGR